jgi:hypothetical protein
MTTVQEQWRAETLAIVAGELRRQFPEMDAYDLVRLVWRTASREPPQIGGLRLLARARHSALSLDRRSSLEWGHFGGASA